jgi:hypothetical protein
MTDDEVRDMETMYREFDYFTKLNAKCPHPDYRWLDCEDCYLREETCGELICVECGASKDDE